MTTVFKLFYAKYLCHLPLRRFAMLKQCSVFRSGNVSLSFQCNYMPGLVIEIEVGLIVLLSYYSEMVVRTNSNRLAFYCLLLVSTGYLDNLLYILYAGACQKITSE